MSVAQTIRNWVAMRNIGGLLGMEWIPARDVRHQRRRYKEKVHGMLEHLHVAETLLDKGEAKRAGDIAYIVFAEFPYAILPEIVRAYDLADEIIARLPPDYVPRDPQPPIVQPRLAADHASNRLAEAATLAERREYDKAIRIVREVRDHTIFPHGGIRATDVQFKAIDLELALIELINRDAS